MSGTFGVGTTARLKGRVVLLTGGSSGIGKATALGLARMDVELTLVCRDRGRGEEARKEIVASSGNQSVDLIFADLLLQREVRRAAAEFLSTRTRLDVLVNNAGSTFPRYAETEDGIERTMALNYFAPFLLTNLLLKVLEASAPSRVVNVSSAAHYRGSLSLAEVKGTGSVGLGGMNAYSRSKLALNLFTFELARREARKEVAANALHPGAVRTNIWSHAGVFSPFARLASAFMPGAESGARTPIYLASSPEVEGVTGKYFDDCRPKGPSAESLDGELATKLWDLSLKMTGLA